MGKVRRSRASIQPPQETSHVSESENDTFMTAKSAQQTFMSVESSFTDANETISKGENDGDDTIMGRNYVAHSENPNCASNNSRVLRSASKKSKRLSSSFSENNTPRAKRCKSADGGKSVSDVDSDQHTKRKLSVEGGVVVKRLESTPTDNCAAKRKATGSEPSRKQLMNLSPIEPVPPTKTEADKKNVLKSGTVEDDKKTTDTLKSTEKPSQTMAGTRSNIATSLQAFGKHPLSSSPARKIMKNSPVRKEPVRQSPLRKAAMRPKLTLPTSPNFATNNRVHHKPIDYVSQAEKEKKIAEEMRMYRFKAQPIPKNITRASSLVRKPEKLPPSKPVPALTRSKSEKAQPAANQAPSKQTVRANLEDNVKSEKNPLGISNGRVQKKRSTDARTPTLTMADRIRQKSERQKLLHEANMARKAAHEKEEKAKRDKFMKAALKGTSGVHTKKQTNSGEKVTKVVPFSFAEQDQQRKAAKERKIQEQFEEEKRKREFKANRPPNLRGISGLPPKEYKPVTRPEPFNLATQDRNLAANTTWSTTIDSIDIPQDDQHVFIAKPMPDFSVPFVPDKPQRAIEPLSITLHTAVRAEDRKPFDDYLKIKEEEINERKKMEMEENEEEERREVAHLRKSLVHHANPIRHYKPTIIEHHRILPTVPESPAFETKTRAQHRAALRAMAALVERQEEEEAFNNSTDTYVL